MKRNINRKCFKPKFEQAKDSEIIDLSPEEALELLSATQEPFDSIGGKIEEYIYDSRTLYLYDDVKPETIDYMTQLIHKWNMDDDIEDIPVEHRQTILIHIASGGGDLLHGLTLVGAIQNSITPVITVSEGGIVASMAFIIFLAGHTRFASVFTDFMYHTLISHMEQSNLPSMHNTVEYYDRLQAKLDKFILERTTIPERTLKAKRKTAQDWFIDSSDIEKFGIATLRN